MQAILTIVFVLQTAAMSALCDTEVCYLLHMESTLIMIAKSQYPDSIAKSMHVENYAAILLAACIHKKGDLVNVIQAQLHGLLMHMSLTHYKVFKQL